MDAAGGVESPASGGGVAMDFTASSPVRVPKRIQKRLLEPRGSPPSSVAEIEAKLRDAHIRRQQFHEWLSSKARSKPRSPSWSAEEEDPGQRLEAKLNAAEQKRLSLLMKAKKRLARLDELRQAAKTGVEMRSEKEREELGTRVESRVLQAEANRMRLLKAHMQRRAAVQERKARSLSQRVIRENKYQECVKSAILQKRAAAEKKRMGLLEAEMRRARARVTQARRVAKAVCHQRESERRRIKEKLDDRLQRAKRQRAEYLKQRGSPNSSSRVNLNKQGDFLSRKLARCWRRFVRSKKTTFGLAKAFQSLEINENSVKSMPFEKLANLIELNSTIQIVKELLQRLETRLLISQSSTSSGPVNIDHLLKRLVTKRRTPPRKSARPRGPAKMVSTKEVKSSEENKLSRYPVRVVLCAYMILGHPSYVLSEQGESEIALRESARNFIQAFELLIKILLESPITAHSLSPSSPTTCYYHQEFTQSSQRKTFKSQLETFDSAWSSYLYRFVVWKVKDARSLEDDLVRAACQLELSMMQTCKLTVEGEASDLSHDMRAIQKQVTEDQKLLRERVRDLSGDAGVERMEVALANARSKFFEAKESGTPIHSVAHIPSPTTSSSSNQSFEVGSEKHINEDTEMSSPKIRSLFGTGASSSSRNPVIRSLFGTGASSSSLNLSAAGAESAYMKKPEDNELLVNEIIFGGVTTFTNTSDVKGDGNSMKAKIKETMEKAFWDSIMESLKVDKPDYSRIVFLVKEVRDELCEMAPRSWKQDILESIDLDILTQVFEAGIQDIDYFGRILEYALVMLQRLSAPAEEDDMKKIHTELLTELSSIAQSDDKKSSSFILATVKGLHFVLEQIQVLKKEINKARIQLMEPIIRSAAGFEYLQKAFADYYGPPSSSINSLPLTVQWVSSLGTSLEEEWNEHVHSLSALSINKGPLVTTLRTGSGPMTSRQSPPDSGLSGGDAQAECKGEKIDVLVRLGLLKLANGIEGLTIDTVPETFRLNASRLRSVQSQLQYIIVISTSMLVYRQILVSENLALNLESAISESFRGLSGLLDHASDVGIQEIVEAVIGPSSDNNLQVRKEMMARLLTKSLQKDDAVFMRVSRVIYLAVRGVVLGGSGACGRGLAEVALQRVGASMLLDRVVKAAEELITLANVSARVHGPWYRSFGLRNKDQSF